MNTERTGMMVTMRKNGWSLQKIGDHYGLSRQRVLQILDKAGAPRINVSMLVRNEGQFREYLKAGLTAKEVSEVLGKTRATIRRAFSDCGLSFPKPPPPPCGEYLKYNKYGCRCRPCKDANNQRMREYYASKRQSSVAG